MKFDLRGLLLKLRYVRKSPYSLPLSLLLLGLTVFSSSAYYNLVLKDKITTSPEQNEPTAAINAEVNNRGEVAGSDTEATSPTPTNKPVTKTPVSNKSTPTPTDKPSEVKEVHTKETIEQQTVVVVTATPVPSPIPTATSAPSPTPTPDTTPFQATIAKETSNRDGSNYLKATVTANKTIKTCYYDIGMISGNKNPDGNTCTAEVGQSPSSPTFHSMTVTSELGETITF